MEHEGDGDTNCNWRTWNYLQRIGKGTSRLRYLRTSINYPDYSITKTGQNTEKSPGDVRKLAVTQPPMKDYQLTLL